MGTISSIAGGEGFPNLGRITAPDFDFDLDALFEMGLRYLLDGLRGLLS